MDVTAIKTISNLQTNFMYLAFLRPISGIITDTQTFTITARETAIPAKTRTKMDYRFLGRQTSIRQGVTHEGEWRCTMVLEEKGTFYNDLVKWFYAVDKSQLNGQDYKTSVVLQLLNIDGSTTNTAYAIIGIYPTMIPNMDGLNQEGTEGHVTFEAVFGYDDVAHGTVSGNTVTWDEEASDVYFPYKDKLTELKTLVALT
jgi:hypothetical protein